MCLCVCVAEQQRVSGEAAGVCGAAAGGAVRAADNAGVSAGGLAGPAGRGTGDPAPGEAQSAGGCRPRHLHPRAAQGE